MNFSKTFPSTYRLKAYNAIDPPNSNLILENRFGSFSIPVIKILEFLQSQPGAYFQVKNDGFRAKSISSGGNEDIFESLRKKWPFNVNIRPFCRDFSRAKDYSNLSSFKYKPECGSRYGTIQFIDLFLSNNTFHYNGQLRMCFSCKCNANAEKWCVVAL